MHPAPDAPRPNPEGPRATGARTNVSSGTPWEAAFGYSRAVRVGPMVWVAGTLAADEQGQIVHPGDPYAQAVYALRKIEKALASVGASLDHVVRTRLYITDMDHQDAIGRAHRDVLGAVAPAATMVQVGPFANPAGLVEIEVEAHVG